MQYFKKKKDILTFSCTYLRICKKFLFLILMIQHIQTATDDIGNVLWWALDFVVKCTYRQFLLELM